MKSIQVNPFIIGAYAGSHYFCDCEREPMNWSKI